MYGANTGLSSALDSSFGKHWLCQQNLFAWLLNIKRQDHAKRDCHLVLSGGNATHIKMSDDCAVYLCTLVSSQHQASLLWRGLGFLAILHCKAASCARYSGSCRFNLGASVVTVDDRFPVRSICSIIVVCRSALITTYPCSISTTQKTNILEQAHAWTCHGVFDTCHQHAMLLALVRLLMSRLSYAGLLYIKLTTFPWQ